jgi:hypothetical protein
MKDLMNGNAVKDIDKWASAKTTFTFDGRKEKEVDEITFYQFVNSYWEGSNIDVDDEETDWEVSGADIEGVSDERNMSSLPSPITKESIREVPPPIFKRSKRMLKKRRRRRFLFNIKIKIFRLTRTRKFRFRPLKWWLFKKRTTRILQRKKSVKLRYRIRRKGKSWLTRYKRLIRKRRR